MKTLSVRLPDDIRKFVDSQLAQGAYRDAAAYVRSLIEAEHERHSKHAATIAQLREQVAIGAEQLERGEYTEYTDEALDQLLGDTETLGRAMLNKRRAGRKT